MYRTAGKRDVSDQMERTVDMRVLDKVLMDALNDDTIHAYRNSHRSLKERHLLECLIDHEYLRSIGTVAIPEEDGQLYPMLVGMLMFGDKHNIMCHIPVFLDYRE